MTGRILVLDTNVARFARIGTLEALASRGLRLRVSETAYLEWWSQGVRMLPDNRVEARAIFFGRAKKIAPLLDQETPIAISAGMLARRIVAEADGQPIPDEYDARERGLIKQWKTVSGIGFTDEEWSEWGRVAEAHLQELDAELIRMALPERELAKKIPAEMKEANDAWVALPPDEQLAHLRRFVKETLKLSDAAAERVDAHIQTTALRLHAAARGARLPKRNDGADVSMSTQVGSGCIMVTDEWQFVDIVDQSGTYQAPWVRRLDDLDELPEGLPWGDTAREAQRAFKRRDDRKKASNA
jgi:hypothetical protein